MSKHLVIYWNEHESSCLVASQTVTGLSFDTVYRSDLEKDATAEQVAATLRLGIAEYLNGNPKVTVLVGGPDVQYRLLSLPPAPLDDIVEMVSLQADGEFASADDGSRLDFQLLSGNDLTPNEVLLARLSSRAAREVNDVLKLLGLEAAHIVPVGISATWFARGDDNRLSRANHLLVCPNSRSLDLALLHDGKLSLGRRVEFYDAEAVDDAKQLITPLRRTVAAASGQMPGEAILSVAWLGALATETAQKLSAALRIDVEVVDVDQVVRDSLGASVKANNLTGFAPHVGAFASVAGDGLAIDFLNPKRRSEAPSNRRTYALAAAAGLLCVLAPAWLGYSRIASTNLQAAELEAQQQIIAKQVEELQPQVERAASIQDWLATDLTWLDELRGLSQQMRPLPLDAKEFNAPGDAMAQQLVMKRLPGDRTGGGEMLVTVTAREWSTFAEIESRLRDASHAVEPASADFDAGNQPYPWKSTTVVKVAEPEVVQ